jgi:hypothetical protein
MSYGMVLAASTTDEPRQVVVISPVCELPAGSKVK